MTDRYDNNSVVRVLNRCTDLVVLNLLFLFCSIPIVTLGASLSAMYAVSLRSVRFGDGYVLQNFFPAFKKNFRQATAAWLGFLAVWFLLYVDAKFWKYSDMGVMADALQMFSIAVAMMFFMVAVWMFPLIAKMQGTLREQFVNACKMSIGYFFPYTVVVVGLPLVAGYLAYINGPMLMLMGIIGCSTIAFISSHFFYKAFANHISEESLGCDDLLFGQNEDASNND
ncbi:MAG: YesL family protein [Lachnospiraceae bacterium]|nr:YesL family protein [Lachnospiraceae bacterium]